MKKVSRAYQWYINVIVFLIGVLHLPFARQMKIMRYLCEGKMESATSPIITRRLLHFAFTTTLEERNKLMREYGQKNESFIAEPPEDPEKSPVFKF